MVSGIVQDIIADTEDSLFWLEFRKETERAFIPGKVYNFDEKKHGTRMTEEFLKKHCKLNKLYQTPHLNDVLYLHYKGFSFIENLQRYTGLKCLWLENNGIREIANLENQAELKCLYLHNNLISKIENLDYLAKLDTLNLSHNTIRRIENLDGLKFLNSLNLSHNYLQGTADIDHLRLLDNLAVLDISHNRIDTDQVVNILGDMKNLRVVSLMGNPVLKTIRLYRKTMILKCINLKYLDDRPVFPRDRACAEAWMRGGPQEEAAERRRWIEAEQKKINDSVQALINKRKLCKPVGTSEKEAEDKKKTKKDEEAATSTLVCASNELLDLEEKKKSDSSSSSGNSSSASDYEDEEVENGGTAQKEIEKIDGRRPVAEEGRKGEVAKEILLPWKIEIPSNEGSKRLLIEEIEETKEYEAADAKILDERTSVSDPPSALGRNLAHYEELVLETSNETEITPPRLKEQATFKSTSVSCDLLNRDSNENKKEEDTDDADEKGDPHPLSSKLSTIREDMKDFCVTMDKFVEDNKIVFKNGDVKGFWGEKEIEFDERSERLISKEKENDKKWWNTRERKLKVREILKKREEARSRNIKKVAEKNVPKKDEEKRETSSQNVYDLLNLKTCPKILLKDVNDSPESEDTSMFCQSTEKDEKRSMGVFNSFFNEINLRSRTDMKPEKALKSTASHELVAIEEVDEVEETLRFSSSNDVTSDNATAYSKLNNDQEIVKKEAVRIEILDANPINSTDDESDESVKTVIDNYEKPAEINEESDLKEKTDEDTSDASKSVDLQNGSKDAPKLHKRTRDYECMDVVSKKSHLIEELDDEKNMQGPKTTSQVAEKCRRHMLREARKFVKKESPLIDKCIENLITNRNDKCTWNTKEDFLTSSALNLTSNLLFRTPEDSEKKPASQIEGKLDIQNVKNQEIATRPESDVVSIARLLEESKIDEDSLHKASANLYQEFCDRLQRMDSKKRLLIEPDFMKSKVALEKEERDVPSPRETKQSKGAQTSPLIEIISADSTEVENVEELEEPLAAAEDSIEMDAALRDKILKSINAPKSDEQRERAKKSADKLMKISREAMAKGKSLLEQSSANSSQQQPISPGDSRRFFMNLLKEESPQETNDDAADSSEIMEKKNEELITEDNAEKTILETDDANSLLPPCASVQDDQTLDTKRETAERILKSIEMQVAQRDNTETAE
ncbi:dynein assembly factor 1, axonemal homolog [Ceratina calcarata]|uniref:Dynein axonemal assembly factor 1 homolog n=1 Tax=Ceratina calcarata TaxID=156304 RepID=A0AAJ7WCU0_9HYME|nr:dynein assembly factor 1, axonemal homolog [Ceratina calcarata]